MIIRAKGTAHVAAGVAVVLLISPSLRAQVSGVVRDADSGLAIEGARVSIQASEHEATTRADGSFEIADATGSNLVVVGAAVGYFNGSVPADAPATGLDIELDPVSFTDDPSYSLRAPGSCYACHSGQFYSWTDSAMANSGTNSWVHDIYDGNGTEYGDGGFVYTRDSRFAADNPASECGACHQPETWVTSPYSALEPPSSEASAVMHGVSCEICHKLAAVDEGKPNFPGLHPDAISFARPAESGRAELVFGLLGDVDYQSPGQMRASYQPQLAAQVCAACHQDKNDPDGDGDFEEDNGVISEPTYLEWASSPYADPNDERYATCVDCHMAPTGATTACGVIPDQGRPYGDLRSHAIEGTTPDYLENAVSLSMEVSEERGTLSVDVSVFNDQTGHHVPTGVTIRNMILLVEARRTVDGKALAFTGTQVVHDLGGVGDPGQGYFAGLPGKLFAKINRDDNGSSPVFFTEATAIVEDSRIPALATDVSHYEFTVPKGGGQILVEARLIYRRSWRALVDAKKWSTDGHGNPLEDVQAPHFGHLMNEAQSLFEATAPPSSDCGCRTLGSFGASGAYVWLGLVAAGLRPGRRKRRR